MVIKEFIKKFAEDKDFAAKYQALPSLDTALEEAKKDGYSITKEEALAALQNKKDGELSDEELASVAGGKNEPVLCPRCGSGNLKPVTLDGYQQYCSDCGNKFFLGGAFTSSIGWLP